MDLLSFKQCSWTALFKTKHHLTKCWCSKVEEPFRLFKSWCKCFTWKFQFSKLQTNKKKKKFTSLCCWTISPYFNISVIKLSFTQWFFPFLGFQDVPPQYLFQERLDWDSDIKMNHQYNAWETPSCLLSNMSVLERVLSVLRCAISQRGKMVVWNLNSQ